MDKPKKINSNNFYLENKDQSKKYSLVEEKRRISLYTKNVLIYGWGKNKYGELGIGHITNINSP